MLLLNYDTLIRHQIQVIHKSRSKINFYFRPSLGNFHKWLLGFMRRRIEKNILKINSSLTEQLFISKGILGDFQSKANELHGKDLNNFIAQNDDLILLHTTFNDEIEKIIAADEKIQFPEMKVTGALLKETIEAQYNILRILKRYNKASSQETSKLAIEASKRSLISLFTIINDRKAT